jgi:ubiquinone/menaquinone biosynthesis C-methylase UbiE
MVERLCPVWVGYLLVSPLRKIFYNPEKILSPYVKGGMKVLDIGCAMGFFSLPIARMVGSNGKVICVDVQEGMIKSLEKRARKSGLSNRIETRICHQNSLGLDDLKEEIDFTFVFAVAHEVLNIPSFFSEIYKTIKSTGRFLLAEPKGHVSAKDFNMTVSVAKRQGFKVIDSPQKILSRAVLLKKRKT